MAQALVNLFRTESRAIADSLLLSLQEQGLDGSVAPAEDASGGAFVMFWRRGAEGD
jgi:hypothetical protein